MMQLAEPVQYQEWDLASARESVQALALEQGALIKALHVLQETYGYVHDEALPMLGKVFNVTRAEVHGVASFYHDFKRHKPGKYVVKVCQAEACQSMGSEALTDAVKKQLGVDFHETTTDGSFSLEPVYCLGNCACSPNIMIDKQVYARMTPDRFKSLTASLGKGDKS
jgi:formate dehydrogenase subunit gamma